MEQSQTSFDFAAHWVKLHRFPVDYEPPWDPSYAQRWFMTWTGVMPCAKCKPSWQKYVSENPVDCSLPEAFFRWGWTAHNYVSANHADKPTMSFEKASKLYL